MLLLVVLGSGGVYFPRARFLLPGFPLLLPLALALARARRTAVVAVCARHGDAVVGVAGGVHAAGLEGPAVITRGSGRVVRAGRA